MDSLRFAHFSFHSSQELAFRKLAKTPIIAIPIWVIDSEADSQIQIPQTS